MCIDLLRFGKCLDVVVLFEQIWCEVDPEDPGRLLVTEIYDILLRAPKGSGKVTEVWALFPHNCFNGGAYQVKAPRVLPYDEVKGEDAVEQRKYDWLFKGSPKWKDPATKSSIVREVPFESQDTFGKLTEPLDGQSLLVEEPSIDIPNIVHPASGEWKDAVEDKDLKKECQRILASDDVRKTVVRIRFASTPLDENERGWMRLIVKPRPAASKTPPVRQVRLPGAPAPPKNGIDDYVLFYEQKLEVWCPLVLRDMLYDNLPQNNAGEAMREFLKALCSHDTPTSTRIGDHRIVLSFPEEEIDIHGANCTGGARYYGTLDFECKSKRLAHIWTCGSERNREDDLVHNAMRVIHRVALFSGSDSREHVVSSQLAPSTKYEAFSLLVRLMAEPDIGIVKRTDVPKEQDREKGAMLALPGQNSYHRDNLPTEEDFDFTKLRTKYIAADVHDKDKELIKGFRDLHPFRIMFGLVWAKPSDRLKRLLAAALSRLGNDEQDEPPDSERRVL